jgi:hypothetical protein
MTNYFVYDQESGTSEPFEADSLSKAKQWVRDWVEGGGYTFESGDKTIFINCRLSEVSEDEDGDEVEEEVAYMTVDIDPPEPKCVSADDDHDWQAPHHILGGLEDNPGVWANGGGVIINECCMKCGCKKITNTWDYHPSTGEQGLVSLRYEEGCYSDEIEAMKEDEEDVAE